ncbi:MAG TPA: MFS transporter [Terriglobales bacterium]|nr:MFS transporter [Terriglobales bacterium]
MATLASPTRERTTGGRELIGLISVSHALQHLYVALLPLTYPLVIAEFHVSYTALGLVLGVVGAVGGLLQGAAGLYQRLSARLVLTVQNLLLAANTVLLALAPTYAVFGAGQFIGGVVSSPQHPVGNAVLTRRFAERGGTVLGWHTTGGNVGTLVIPLVASLVIVHWGWRAAMLVTAVPIAAGGLLVSARLREGPAASGDGRRGGTPGGLKAAVLRRSTLTIIAAGTVAAGGRGLGAVNAFVPAYLRDGLGLAQVTVGLIFTVILASSVVGPIVAGQLADRFGRRLVAIAAYVIGGAALGLFGMTGASIPALLRAGRARGRLRVRGVTAAAGAVRGRRDRRPPPGRVRHLLRDRVRGRLALGHRPRMGDRPPGLHRGVLDDGRVVRGRGGGAAAG